MAREVCIGMMGRTCAVSVVYNIYAKGNIFLEYTPWYFPMHAAG